MLGILVDITVHLDKISDVDTILAKEIKVGQEMKAEGILTALFYKTDKTGAYAFFTGIDENQLKKELTRFPLSAYFEKVEFSIVDRQF